MSIDATTIRQVKVSGFGQVPAWLWLGAGLYVLLLVNSSGLLNDSDTYWQIAVGQWILDHGAMPRVDVYSFSMPGEAWISSSWLAQVLYAVSYNLAGWTGPVVVAAGGDRCDLRAARAYPGAPPSLDLCGPGRAGGHGAVDAAFSGASARAGDAGHGCLGARFDDGERAASAAVILVAAADCALGQSAWRLRVRSGAGGRVRDRRAVERRAVAAGAAGAALVRVRVGCIGGLLRHALRLGIDPRFTQDSRSWRTPAAASANGRRRISASSVRSS